MDKEKLLSKEFECIYEYNISSNRKNDQILTVCAKKLKIAEEKIGLPFVVVRDRCIMGFDKNISIQYEQLIKLISKK